MARLREGRATTARAAAGSGSLAGSGMRAGNTFVTEASCRQW